MFNKAENSVTIDACVNYYCSHLMLQLLIQRIKGTRCYTEIQRAIRIAVIGTVL